MVKALAPNACGIIAGAVDILKRALVLAKPEGYVRIFLDEGTPLLTLLSHVGEVDSSMSAYVRTLLARQIGVTGNTLNTSPDTTHSRQQLRVDPLSERELEVLYCMGAGASNEEVAEQLVIAVGTVKRHVSNILAKLAVTNRTQAVARARELDLL